MDGPKWKDIVSNHHLYSTSHKTVKGFAGLTLGYVTPVGCLHWETGEVEGGGKNRGTGEETSVHVSFINAVE